MGRVEKTLLTFLLMCASVVGWLSWRSAPVSRGRPQPAGDSTDIQSRASTATLASSHAATASGTSVAQHVSGALVRSALPPPVRDLPVLRREIASRAHGTYIEHILLQNDSSIVRWPERYNNPVKVWIQASSDLADWSPTMATSARDAFGIWSSIKVPVQFEFVNDSASAEMVLAWVDQFSGPQVGSTRRFRDQHGWLGRAEIVLALHTAAGTRIDSRYLTAVAIHEIGHALGLDHSPSNTDIMAARNDGVFLPTAADQATMALLYSVPPGSLRN